jgi:transposase
MKPIQLTPEQRQDMNRRRKASHDRRLYERLTAVLAVDAGKTREEVAEFLGVSLTQLGEWLRIFRNQGLDVLCTLHHQGDPGNLTAAQVEQLKNEVRTGRFRNSDQIRHWLQETFGVRYTSSGVKQLLKRIGASYHKVTGFLWKANPDKQHEFVAHYQRQKAAAKRPGAKRTRRYFVDACHPLWGLELVYACWLLVGQRFLAGMGSGRQRLNILGGGDLSSARGPRHLWVLADAVGRQPRRRPACRKAASFLQQGVKLTPRRRGHRHDVLYLPRPGPGHRRP